jgi:anti-anti-sigma factor
MREMNFTVTSKTIRDTAVLYPRGYLNNIAGESLVRECNAYIEKGIKKMVVNLGGIEFINSIGISLLLSVIERLNNCGGTLCLTNISTSYNETFEMLGLTKYMLVFKSEEEALKHLNAAGGK